MKRSAGSEQTADRSTSSADGSLKTKLVYLECKTGAERGAVGLSGVPGYDTHHDIYTQDCERNKKLRTSKKKNLKNLIYHKIKCVNILTLKDEIHFGIVNGFRSVRDEI